MDASSFYSMDKLVAFGMSTAVANQMTASMNASLTQTRIPGADNAMNQVDGRDIYFVAMNDISSGPYSAIELARLIADGKVVKETYVWKPGMTKWDLVENMNEVLGLVALTPPPIPEG